MSINWKTQKSQFSNSSTPYVEAGAQTPLKDTNISRVRGRVKLWSNRKATCWFFHRLPPGATVNRRHPTLRFHCSSTHPHSALTHHPSRILLLLFLLSASNCLPVDKEADRPRWSGKTGISRKRQRASSLIHIHITKDLIQAPAGGWTDQSESDTRRWSVSIPWLQSPRHPPLGGRREDGKQNGLHAPRGSQYAAYTGWGSGCLPQITTDQVPPTPDSVLSLSEYNRRAKLDHTILSCSCFD